MPSPLYNTEYNPSNAVWLPVFIVVRVVLLSPFAVKNTQPTESFSARRSPFTYCMNMILPLPMMPPRLISPVSCAYQNPHPSLASPTDSKHLQRPLTCLNIPPHAIHPICVERVAHGHSLAKLAICTMISAAECERPRTPRSRNARSWDKSLSSTSAFCGIGPLGDGY